MSTDQAISMRTHALISYAFYLTDDDRLVRPASQPGTSHFWALAIDRDGCKYNKRPTAYSGVRVQDKALLLPIDHVHVQVQQPSSANGS